jgi:acyl-[acyl-carrier-protein] desaturase
MAVSRATSEKLYREYMSFFEKAEKHRRWSIFDDLPWEKAETCPKDPVLALCAETFCGVEMYLPDYVGQGINVMRENFGTAWFMANWGYEESKHSLALREYLLRTGQRTTDQIYDYEQQILTKKWSLPFPTARQMSAYGMIQELTTYVFYKKHKQLAIDKGDELLAAIYGLVSRDEIAHFGFYASVSRVLLEEDAEGFKRDLAHVFRHFTMPAYDLVPDYGDRVEFMRQAGMDRGAFVREVWLPVLKAIGLSRHELVGYDRRDPAVPEARA